MRPTLAATWRRQLLAELLGGTPFLGLILAVAFATILAVVAGLTLPGAAALSHDLWVNGVRGGRSQSDEELRAARFATVALGGLAIALGISLEGQNVAFMVALAFALAASANFAAVVLAIFWPRLITAGTVASRVITIPLSFGVGILVSLLRPEPVAEARFRALARQVHLGHGSE